MLDLITRVINVLLNEIMQQSINRNILLSTARYDLLCYNLVIPYQEAHSVSVARAFPQTQKLPIIRTKMLYI